MKEIQSEKGMLSRDEIIALQNEIKELGPRFTGSNAHKSYIELLQSKLESYGLTVQQDELNFQKWEANSWNLTVQKDEKTKLEIPCSHYFPYSGSTNQNGVTGELVYCKKGIGSLKKVKGKIAVIEIDVKTVFSSLIFDQRNGYPSDSRLPRKIANPVISSVLCGHIFKKVAKAGAIGAVYIWDNFSFDNARGQALPFTMEYQDCPSLWVSMESGRKLKKLAKRKEKATLTLVADKYEEQSKTIYTTVPGRDKKETIIINTHTDGPNACEENGGIALLSLARYYAGLPIEKRNKSMIFVFVTGHFQIPQFGVNHNQATSRWLSMHKELWDGKENHKKAVAGITIEHLGCTEWRDNETHTNYRQTNPIEFELVYTANKVMNQIYLNAVKSRKKVRSITLKPHNGIYFGEGQPLYKEKIPTISLVPGPDYLCRCSENGDIDKLDFELMEEQIISFCKILKKIDNMDAKNLGTPDSQSYGMNLF